MEQLHMNSTWAVHEQCGLPLYSQQPSVIRRWRSSSLQAPWHCPLILRPVAVIWNINSQLKEEEEENVSALKASGFFWTFVCFVIYCRPHWLTLVVIVTKDMQHTKGHVLYTIMKRFKVAYIIHWIPSRQTFRQVCVHVGTKCTH